MLKRLTLLSFLNEDKKGQIDVATGIRAVK